MLHLPVDLAASVVRFLALSDRRYGWISLVFLIMPENAKVAFLMRGVASWGTVVKVTLRTERRTSCGISLSLTATRLETYLSFLVLTSKQTRHWLLLVVLCALWRCPSKTFLLKLCLNGFVLFTRTGEQHFIILFIIVNVYFTVTTAILFSG